MLREYFRTTASRYGVVRMALFGSVARNEHTADSDLDIAYEGIPNLFLRIRMKAELETLMKCKVDLVRLTSREHSTFFDQEIEKDLLYV